ncbi:MAG: hypothetical protein ABH950_05800 [Candidatus Altiarchaeota archaeon]
MVLMEDEDTFYDEEVVVSGDGAKFLAYILVPVILIFGLIIVYAIFF